MAAVWHPISANVCKAGEVTTAPVVSGWLLQGESFVPPRRHTLPTRGQVLRLQGNHPAESHCSQLPLLGVWCSQMGQSQAWGHVWGLGDRDRS